MKAAALTRITLGLAAIFATGAAWAQAGKGPAQVVKPPVSQAWIDVATFAGMGMPSMGGGGGGPMSTMGSMFGGGQGGKNTFGMTQTGSAGRWVDVTLYTSRNPALPEALQAVPAGTQLAPTLKLVAPKVEKGPPPPPGDDTVVEHEYERPKGKMYLYWGCGDTVRVSSVSRPRFQASISTRRRSSSASASSLKKRGSTLRRFIAIRRTRSPISAAEWPEASSRAVSRDCSGASCAAARSAGARAGRSPGSSSAPPPCCRR